MNATATAAKGCVGKVYDGAAGAAEQLRIDRALKSAPRSLSAPSPIPLAPSLSTEKMFGPGDRQGITLPVAEGALENDALRSELTGTLKAILETYTREHPDTTAATEIARTMRVHDQSRRVASDEMARRAPNRGTPRREAYDAAKDALKQ
jgi:hypothetical protein